MRQPSKRHWKQVKAFHDLARFKAILAGRRGGKTHLLREDICRKIYAAPNKGEIFYIAPTNQQAIELIWEPLEERLDQLKWRHKAKISKQRFELTRDRKIYVIGAEKIRRVRGHKVWHAYLDEVAFFEVDLWKVWRALRPALSDLKGGATVATTPDGKGTQAYDFYMAAMRTPGWAYHYWRTLDNPFIDPNEIAAARRELDEKSFRQEYEAVWESFVGLAYYNFMESLHLKPQRIIHELPVHLCFDFNVNPTTLLLSQKVGDQMKYVKEYSLPNSSTESTVIAFAEEFKDFKDVWNIIIRGDSSGKNRSSNTGKSDYYYAEEILTQYGFKHDRQVLARNPPIVDRVKIANGWLKPFQGNHRVEIDPTCVELIRDLASQELDGRHPSPRNNRGHKADAFGYDIYYEHLMAMDTGVQGTREL